MSRQKAGGVWGASQCALLLIDYQDHVLIAIFEQDRRVIELNARTLAKAARAFNIPVILSTVACTRKPATAGSLRHRLRWPRLPSQVPEPGQRRAARLVLGGVPVPRDLPGEP